MGHTRIALIPCHVAPRIHGGSRSEQVSLYPYAPAVIGRQKWRLLIVRLSRRVVSRQGNVPPAALAAGRRRRRHVGDFRIVHGERSRCSGAGRKEFYRLVQL